MRSRAQTAPPLRTPPAHLRWCSIRFQCQFAEMQMVRKPERRFFIDIFSPPLYNIIVMRN